MAHLAQAEFKSLGIAVLTISDTRIESNDTSGQYLADALGEAGHRLIDKNIVIDDIYQIRAQISQWVINPEIQVILTTGGTGFTVRDNTPEAVSILFDKDIEGFGELFRQISYTEIGTSTVQSRALAGFINRTGVFCVPGSTNACKTAWQKILLEQLDSRQKPCNFAPHLKA
ncbi:molybdenum cofactor biosynthesis protein B [Alginatibacterium sediminis]|uniref:Molybdenum cofactor biosynthesis protein B n=1 Tax=Alginatibacterium sediminis TaxID=2164068 RepID=A0A420EHM4_9ALTE|nr:molybdenum cofactor biosynthesis protein B [Alginatibacterium sediminis]RKF20154.1 molybdenum cofactor biosynthesis protein B [Alginatibacterium sediminis]